MTWSVIYFKGEVRPRKNNVEFPALGVFVFGLGISKESNTILWNIQGLSFVLSGISRGKVRKNSREFQKSISSNPPVLIFSGIAQCNIHSLHVQLISNGALIQVELGLNIVEIYVDQHSKS